MSASITPYPWRVAYDVGEIDDGAINTGLQLRRLVDAAEAVVEAAEDGGLGDLRREIARLRRVLLVAA